EATVRNDPNKQGTPYAPVQPKVDARAPVDSRVGASPSVVQNNPPPPVWPTQPAAPPSGEMRTEFRQPGTLVANQPTPSPTPRPSSTTSDLAKVLAQQLVVAARQLQREGRLIEARQQALEAQKLGAAFGPNDDRPERVLIELSGLCHKRIESLVQQATDYAATAQADPARFQKAEADLAQARQLAIGFGVDTQAIDGKLAWVRQTSMAALGTVPRTDFPSPADAPARGVA